MKIIIIISTIALVIVIFSISYALRQPLDFKGDFSELAQLSASEYKDIDIAQLNLICAEGLLGAESLNVDESLAVLDAWAQLVKENESKYFYQYQRNPAQYDHSIAKFKAVNLGLTLKDDLGCGYNQDLVRQGLVSDVKSTRFFKNSQDLFLHGFTQDRKGSCSSLPVLMVAIGRRCGYPLFLVSCKGHLFCRWDNGSERFNIETACPGIDSKPDSYYMNWPFASSAEEIRSERYLKNLSTEEEFGIFSQIRGACLQENGRFEEASAAYRCALKAFPESEHLKEYLKYVESRSKPQ